MAFALARCACCQAVVLEPLYFAGTSPHGLHGCAMSTASLKLVARHIRSMCSSLPPPGMLGAGIALHTHQFDAFSVATHVQQVAVARGLAASGTVLTEPLAHGSLGEPTALTTEACHSTCWHKCASNIASIYAIANHRQQTSGYLPCQGMAGQCPRWATVLQCLPGLLGHMFMAGSLYASTCSTRSSRAVVPAQPECVGAYLPVNAYTKSNDYHLYSQQGGTCKHLIHSEAAVCITLASSKLQGLASSCEPNETLAIFLLCEQLAQGN